MQAMLRMGKIDIAGIEAASRGGRNGADGKPGRSKFIARESDILCARTMQRSV